MRDGPHAAGRTAELGGDGGLVGGVDGPALVGPVLIGPVLDRDRAPSGTAFWGTAAFSATAGQRAGSTPAGPSATSRQSWRYQGSPSEAGSAARSVPVDGSWTM